MYNQNVIDNLIRQKDKIDEMINKYLGVSNTLFDLFMVEHNNIGNIFKEE